MSPERHLKDTIMQQYPGVWDVTFDSETDGANVTILISVSPNADPPCLSALSRLVASSYRTGYYTIDVRFHHWSPCRIRVLLGRDVMHSTFVYVLLATLGSSRIPMAAFANRALCEAAVKDLPSQLATLGLHMSDCDQFAIEQWQLNGFLKGPAVQTLSSYDKKGQLDRELVPQGMEGKTDLDKKANRFKILLGE